MKQEDNFIEVTTNIRVTTPVLRWFFPVRIKKLRLLFDVYAWIFVSRQSNLDFTEAEKMDPEEFLVWSVYGAHASYLSLNNDRIRAGVEEVQRWVKGMLMEDRERILKTIIDSRSIGESAGSYQEAMVAMAEEEEGPKKDSVSGQTN
jgi:hypothetical protein